MSRIRTRKYRTGGTPCILIGGTSKLGPTQQLNAETCVDELHPGPPYKRGGPLNVSKRTLRPGYSRSLSLTHPFAAYKGAFYMDPPNATTSVPADINLTGIGAEAFSRALPVHDLLNLGQFVVEMKDIPSMITSTRDFFKQFNTHAYTGRSAAFWSEAYLNYQFGWKPYISDLWKLLSFQNKIGARLGWMRKNNGRNVRRSFNISNTATNTLVDSSESLRAILPTMNAAVYPPAPLNGYRYETWKYEERRIWFSGCFTFLVPKLDLVPGHDTQLRLKLMGLMPDLNLVYKVMPWTWLGDWFVSTGSMFQNQHLMMAYNQVARYAFVMSSQKTAYVKYAYQNVYAGNYPKMRTEFVGVTSSTEVEKLQRIVANPYGFGIVWDSLSLYQLSILAALGITRGTTP